MRESLVAIRETGKDREGGLIARGSGQRSRQNDLPASTRRLDHPPDSERQPHV